MAVALITANILSIGGLGFCVLLGYTARPHILLAIFVTLITLLAHSMTMFYLIGKGRAVRDAVTEGGLPARFVSDIAEARRPVFSIGTLAIALTMATAIVGGGTDTGVIPPAIHGLLGVSAVAMNAVALRTEAVALTASARVVDTVNRLIGAS